MVWRYSCIHSFAHCLTGGASHHRAFIYKGISHTISNKPFTLRSQDSSVGMTTTTWIARLGNNISILGRKKNLFPKSSPPVLGPTQLPVQWNSWPLSAWSKAAEAWGWTLTEFSSKVNNEWNLAYIFPQAFISRTESVTFTVFASLQWISLNAHRILGCSMQCDLVSAYSDLTVVISVSDQVGVRGEVALAPYRLHTVQDR